MLGGTGIIFALWYTWKLNAGILALENYYLYTIDVQKPFTKILAFGFGLMLVDFHLHFRES